MDPIFSDRISDVPKSFVREILKTTLDDSVISFAGGLPNRDLFPVAQIKESMNHVMDTAGREALQYGTSEGYLPLREWISDRYRKNLKIDVPAENILITTGSQQGLDLLGKTLLNEGDEIAIEEPGYLGAIQAFSLYRARFHPVALDFEGIRIADLEKACQHPLKLFYCVPNFQNPSGISHSDENRDGVAEVIGRTSALLIEDDPYGELRFSGTPKSSYYSRIPEQTVLLGSFSKIFAPSFRIGWIASPSSLMEKLVIAKQASDLHTNYFGQRVAYDYLTRFDLDQHIEKIRSVYRRQADAMIAGIRRDFPEEMRFSEPEGGMFLWAEGPTNLPARSIFEESVKEKVVFVPGDPFYVKKTHVSSMRLNFSSVDEKTIAEGIRRLGSIIKSALFQRSR